MHDCYSSLHESYMEEEMQSRQAFGFLRFAFGYIWKKKNFHYLRLYLDKTADYADAPSARNASLSLVHSRPASQPLWRCLLI